MEIEKKFLVKSIPDNLDSYKLRIIEQGYLCTVPAIRVRKDNDLYYMTYKSGGVALAHEEANLPLTEEAYEHLLPKSDGIIISKKRYEIPHGAFTIELDIFEKDLEGLVVAEVEFDSVEEADEYVPPHWFGEEVTMDKRYSNAHLSKFGRPTERDL